MAGLVLGGHRHIAAQGHAKVTDQPALQITAQAVHIAAAAVWITGLALVVMLFARAPAVAPARGRLIAGHGLLAFSTAATVSVVLLFATGVLRTVGELGDPAQLWDTAYGCSSTIRIRLWCPGAMRCTTGASSRRSRVMTPNRATTLLVSRTVGVELTLSLVIVLVATLLVARSRG